MKHLSQENKEYIKRFNKLLQFEKLKEIVEKRGGKILSKEYKGQNTHLNLKCSAGHVWKSLPNNIKSGYWCNQCIRPGPKIKLAKETAKEKKGVCVSNIVKTPKDKLHWKCKNKHNWEANYSSVVKNNSWCNQCYLLGEKKIDNH